MSTSSSGKPQLFAEHTTRRDEPAKYKVTSCAPLSTRTRLAARVISIDIWPDLAAQARRNLTAQGIGNVVILTGDGTDGALDFAPFDAIVVCAAYPRVPPPLAAQLKIGGHLVQPVGPGGAEHVVLYQKERDGLRRVRTVTAASFVRPYGRHGFPRSEP